MIWKKVTPFIFLTELRIYTKVTWLTFFPLNCLQSLHILESRGKIFILPAENFPLTSWQVTHLHISFREYSAEAVLGDRSKRKKSQQDLEHSSNHPRQITCRHFYVSYIHLKKLKSITFFEVIDYWSTLALPKFKCAQSLCGGLLKFQIPGPYPRPTKSESWSREEGSQRIFSVKCSPGDSGVFMENYCLKTHK